MCQNMFLTIAGLMIRYPDFYLRHFCMFSVWRSERLDSGWMNAESSIKQWHVTEPDSLSLVCVLPLLLSQRDLWALRLAPNPKPACSSRESRLGPGKTWWYAMCPEGQSRKKSIDSADKVTVTVFAPAATEYPAFCNTFLLRNSSASWLRAQRMHFCLHGR